MCTLLDAMVNEGMEKGMEKGRQQGMQKGMQQEREIARKILKLALAGMPKDEIAKNLGLEDKVVDQYFE